VSVIHPPTTGPIVGATPAAAVMKEAAIAFCLP
jgi:hypothetical protein